MLAIYIQNDMPFNQLQNICQLYTQPTCSGPATGVWDASSLPLVCWGIKMIWSFDCPLWQWLKPFEMKQEIWDLGLNDSSHISDLEEHI